MCSNFFQEIQRDTTSRQAPVSQPQADIVDLANFQGERAVHVAAMGGHVAFLQFLSWNNADMNAQVPIL
jgi:hypothetical protein